MASGVFGHRDLNVILGPMAMDGVINQRRARMEHDRVAPLSWPPRMEVVDASARATCVTTTGIFLCREHAQRGNFRTTPLHKTLPTFCAVHDG